MVQHLEQSPNQTIPCTRIWNTEHDALYVPYHRYSGQLASIYPTFHARRIRYYSLGLNSARNTMTNPPTGALYLFHVWPAHHNTDRLYLPNLWHVPMALRHHLLVYNLTYMVVTMAVQIPAQAPNRIFRNKPLELVHPSTSDVKNPSLSIYTWLCRAQNRVLYRI